MTKVLPALDKRFRLEEATIGELHAAIKAGDTTCVAVVQTYIARVRAYNGVASALVTEEGAPVAPATGTVRAGTALRFPTETVKASTLLPDLDKYTGPPLEYGRMEATASDPARAAAVRHDRRYSQRRPGERARDAEHPRRALGHLPRRFRSPPLAGIASVRCAAGVRILSPFSRCARTRRRARCPVRSTIPISTRCRCTASCSRSRIRSTPRTCAPPVGAMRPTTSISRRATTCWSSSYATRAPSSSPRQ